MRGGRGLWYFPSIMAWLVTLLAFAGSGEGTDLLRWALEREAAGQDPEAIEALERASLANPGWEIPRLENARLRLKTGRDLERAKFHLEAARARAPENPRGQYLWALLMDEEGNPDAARAALELATLYRSDFADAQFRLAGVLYAAGEWQAAERRYRATIAVWPQFMPARLQLARALEKQGKLGECEHALERLLEENPGAPAVIRQLADFYDRTDRRELAERVRKSQEGKAPVKRMRALGPSKR